jgi:hypothetical protein
VNGRPFQPGQSGNPGGRPKTDPEVKALARAYTEEAIDRLAYWMKSDDQRASVAAANALLDRAWGKAARAATTEGDEGPITVIINHPGKNDQET